MNSILDNFQDVLMNQINQPLIITIHEMFIPVVSRQLGHPELIIQPSAIVLIVLTGEYWERLAGCCECLGNTPSRIHSESHITWNTFIHIYTYIYIYIYIYVYIYTCIHVDECMYVRMFLCIYKYLYISIYVYTYICIYSYIHTNIYIHLHIYVCICR
jgi:hypothetical protein